MHRVVGRLPAAGFERRLQPGQGRGVALEGGQVGRQGGLPAAGVQRRISQPPGIPGRAAGGRQQPGPPGGLLERGAAGPGGAKALQRPHGVGQRLQKAVDLQQGLAGRGVGAAAAVEVGKGAEIRVGIGGFQHPGKHLLPQGKEGALVGGGKVRRDVQRAEMLLQKVQAEGVDGADGRALQKHALAAGRAGGVLQLLLVKAAGDAPAHLGRGGVGKGDDEQLVGPHLAAARQALAEQPHRPLGEHRGFAAARRRADEQRPALGSDGGLLRVGPGRAGAAFPASLCLSAPAFMFALYAFSYNGGLVRCFAFFANQFVKGKKSRNIASSKCRAFAGGPLPPRSALAGSALPQFLAAHTVTSPFAGSSSSKGWAGALGVISFLPSSWRQTSRQSQ